MVGARGDKSNPQTKGYACIKGLYLHEAHNSPDRLLRPLKRQPDGRFEPISLEQALDEIAARVRTIIQDHGADAIAAFRGTMNYSNLSANHMLPEWLRALGSRSFYSTMTVDQSAKWVTFERLGGWAAGRDPYQSAQVLLLVGTNPLVSLSTFNCALQDPQRSLHDFRHRGGKLIVIDPRCTETARHADLFLQPRPGEDPTLIAGLLQIIIQRSWHDAEFCERYVNGLAGLTVAVAPFVPSYVAQRTGVPEADLVRAAQLFAHDAKRGSAASGTGPNMARHSNLAEHLIECLNVVCGRYARAGDPVVNPGVLGPRRPQRAEVIPPNRSWERGPKSPSGGYGMLFGQRMSGALADDILTDAPGAVRALFVDGGNPAIALPDQHKTATALAALPLLVTIDPFMTATARMSHYILPPRMMFERADLPSRDYESIILFRPYAQYTAPVVAAPAHSEVVDDWYPFWAIASRLGRQINYDGVDLDMHQAPTTESLLRILTRHGQVPLSELMSSAAGQVYSVPSQRVEPGQGAARFDVMPADVASELRTVWAEGHQAVAPAADFAYRLIARRMREVQNTMYHDLPAIRRRVEDNPAHMHPDALAQLGLLPGTWVTIRSAHGQLNARVAADPTLRRDTVSLTHGWGDMAGTSAGAARLGCNVNGLTSDIDRDPLNAMPVLTALPVSISPT